MKKWARYSLGSLLSKPKEVENTFMLRISCDVSNYVKILKFI